MAGTALIGIRGGEYDLALGFLPVGAVERFAELAAAAGVEIAIHGPRATVEQR